MIPQVSHPLPSVTGRDLRELAKLRDARTDSFRGGVLFHAGRQTLPFGDRLWAVPFSGLWANGHAR